MSGKSAKRLRRITANIVETAKSQGRTVAVDGYLIHNKGPMKGCIIVDPASEKGFHKKLKKMIAANNGQLPALAPQEPPKPAFSGHNPPVL